MDGKPVTNLKVKLATGSASFTTNNGSDAFEISFQNTPTGLDSRPVPFELAGTHWSIASPSNSQAFTSQQFFPLQSKEQNKMHSNGDQVDLLHADILTESENFWATTMGASLTIACGFILAWPGQKMYEYIASSCCKKRKKDTPLQKNLIKMQADLIKATREAVKEQVKKLNLSPQERDVIGQNARDEANRWLADNDKNITDQNLLAEHVREQLDISIRETVTDLFIPKLSKHTRSLDSVIPAAALDIVRSSCDPRADELFQPKLNEIDAYIADVVDVELKDREWQESKNKIAELANDIKAGKEKLDKLESEKNAAHNAAKDAMKKPQQQRSKVEEDLIINFNKAKQALDDKNTEIAEKEKKKTDEEKIRDTKEKEKIDKEKEAEKSHKEAFK